MNSRTTRPEITGPASGRMLPTLMLHAPDGSGVPLWRWRTRCPLVLLVHRGPQDLEWIMPFAERHADIRDAQAEALAIGPRVLPGLPFPSLVDPEPRLAHALGLEPPAVIVADRPGEVWAAWGSADDGPAELPGVDEAITWLEYAQSECRECFCCELVWPAELMAARSET